MINAGPTFNQTQSHGGRCMVCGRTGPAPIFPPRESRGNSALRKHTVMRRQVPDFIDDAAPQFCDAPSRTGTRDKASNGAAISDSRGNRKPDFVRAGCGFAADHSRGRARLPCYKLVVDFRCCRATVTTSTTQPESQMNIAQQIANQAQRDFGAAIRSAVAQGRRGAVWFGGCEYAFGDGSVLTLRSGKVESPAPSVEWNTAMRVAFDI